MASKTIPHRVQLRRTKGWRMPPNTVSVARPTRWGNPFVIGGWWARRRRRMTRQDAVDRHAEWAAAEKAGEIRAELRGKNLACWCKPGDLCHADTLLRIANVDTFGEMKS